MILTQSEFVQFKCGFCNKTCCATLDNYTILHETPTCLEYDKIRTVDDGTKFMKAAREKIEKNLSEMHPLKLVAL